MRPLARIAGISAAGDRPGGDDPTIGEPMRPHDSSPPASPAGRLAQTRVKAALVILVALGALTIVRGRLLSYAH